MKYIAENSGMGLYTGRKDSKGNPILAKNKAKAKKYTHLSRAENVVDSFIGNDQEYSVISESSIAYYLKTQEEKDFEERDRRLGNNLKDIERYGLLSLSISEYINHEYIDACERLIKSNYPDYIRIDFDRSTTFFKNMEKLNIYLQGLERKIESEKKQISDMQEKIAIIINQAKWFFSEWRVMVWKQCRL